MIGLTLEEVLSSHPSAVVTYAMDPLPSGATPYSAPQIAAYDSGWPAHALQWKDYLTNQSFSFDISAAQAAIMSAFGLGLNVHAINAGSLNTIEAAGAVFSSDPPGTWMEARFTDPATTFAYAALVMHFWDSPVYLDATHNYPSGGNFSHAIALQELEFTLPSAPDLLAACGLHGAVLTDDRVSLWNDNLCIGCPGSNYLPYDPYRVLAPNDLTLAWWSSLGSRGQIVFDPPAEATEEDLEGLAVLASALAEQILVEDPEGYLMLMVDVVPEGELPEG